jgi:hypothetical protein
MLNTIRKILRRMRFRLQTYCWMTLWADLHVGDTHHNGWFFFWRCERCHREVKL